MIGFSHVESKLEPCSEWYYRSSSNFVNMWLSTGGGEPGPMKLPLKIYILFFFTYGFVGIRIFSSPGLIVVASPVPIIINLIILFRRLIDFSNTFFEFYWSFPDIYACHVAVLCPGFPSDGHLCMTTAAFRIWFSVVYIITMNGLLALLFYFEAWLWQWRPIWLRNNCTSYRHHCPWVATILACEGCS